MGKKNQQDLTPTINEIQQIFPQCDHQTILDVLMKNKLDMAAAVEELLRIAPEGEPWPNNLPLCSSSLDTPQPSGLDPCALPFVPKSEQSVSEPVIEEFEPYEEEMHVEKDETKWLNSAETESPLDSAAKTFELSTAIPRKREGKKRARERQNSEDKQGERQESDRIQWASEFKRQTETPAVSLNWSTSPGTTENGFRNERPSISGDFGIMPDRKYEKQDGKASKAEIYAYAMDLAERSGEGNPYNVVHACCTHFNVTDFRDLKCGNPEDYEPFRSLFPKTNPRVDEVDKIARGQIEKHVANGEAVSLGRVVSDILRLKEKTDFKKLHVGTPFQVPALKELARRESFVLIELMCYKAMRTFTSLSDFEGYVVCRYKEDNPKWRYLVLRP